MISYSEEQVFEIFYAFDSAIYCNVAPSAGFL